MKRNRDELDTPRHEWGPTEWGTRWRASDGVAMEIIERGHALYLDPQHEEQPSLFGGRDGGRFLCEVTEQRTGRRLVDWTDDDPEGRCDDLARRLRRGERRA